MTQSSQSGSSLHSIPAHVIYAEQLFQLGFGMPLWIPERCSDNGGVLIGDVGFLKGGGFHRVFNARLPPSHASNRAHGTPYALPAEDGNETPKHTSISIGSGIMCSEGVSRGSMCSTKENFTEIEQQLICKKAKGAILVQEGTTRYELPASSSRTIGRYMLHHYTHWHRFARNSLQRTIPRGALLLVCGCTQSIHCAMTAFWDQREPTGTEKLKFQAGRHKGYPSLTPRLSTDSSIQVDVYTPANTLASDEIQVAEHFPAPRWTESQETLVQPKARYTTFVNYYKFRWRSPEDSSQNHEEILNDVYDPVDQLLDYILKYSHARAAAAHDGELYALLTGRAFPEDWSDFLQELSPSIEVDEDGLGMLKSESSAFNGVMSTMHSLFRHVHTGSTTFPGENHEQQNVLTMHGSTDWLPNALEELRTTLVRAMAPGMPGLQDPEEWFPGICDMASFTASGCKTVIRTLRTKGFNFDAGNVCDEHVTMRADYTNKDDSRHKIQLQATMLWAELLRNCSRYFFRHCTSTSFIHSLRGVLASDHTIPLVHATLLDVLGNAALISKLKWNRDDNCPIQGLWRDMKRSDQPRMGLPCDIGLGLTHDPTYRRDSRILADSQSNTEVIFNVCDMARSNADMLWKALMAADREDDNDMKTLQALYAKCFTIHSFLSTQAMDQRVAQEVSGEVIRARRVVAEVLDVFGVLVRRPWTIILTGEEIAVRAQHAIRQIV
ncbi:hypothetical protein CERSUDRAFT_116674, partial [Gelatoporia subvermispora B]